jgi:hypothetical protein
VKLQYCRTVYRGKDCLSARVEWPLEAGKPRHRAVCTAIGTKESHLDEPFEPFGVVLFCACHCAECECEYFFGFCLDLPNAVVDFVPGFLISQISSDSHSII